MPIEGIAEECNPLLGRAPVLPAGGKLGPSTFGALGELHSWQPG